jgi:hypothetical protein
MNNDEQRKYVTITDEKGERKLEIDKLSPRELFELIWDGQEMCQSDSEGTSLAIKMMNREITENRERLEKLEEMMK